MKNAADVDKLEKLISQVQGLHSEISLLAKKAPNDGLNKFKLKFVNRCLSDANGLLGKGYIPFKEFAQFEESELPTNSDVTMMLFQYIEQIERFRSDNVKQNDSWDWKYVIAGKISDIPALPPTMVGATKK